MLKTSYGIYLKNVKKRVLIVEMTSEAIIFVRNFEPLPYITLFSARHILY